MSCFDDAFAILIGEEGGYSADPRDPGNWTGGNVNSGVLKGTKFGIAAHVYPHLDIVNLTVPQAKDIYRRDYWDKVRGDDLPWPLALYVFDAAVNQGPVVAIMLMQDALGVQSDGAIGPVTLAAAKTATTRRMDKFMALRARRYANTRNFDTFGTGWLTRLFSVARQGATGA